MFTPSLCLRHILKHASNFSYFQQKNVIIYASWYKLILNVVNVNVVNFFIGNPNDKILYGRLPSKRAQLERRHSLRLFGSNKRLSALHRTGSMRHLPCRQISQESTTTTETAIIPHCSPSM